MWQEGSSWGWAVTLGTALLALAIAYALVLRARKFAARDAAAGRDPGQRWTRIAIAALVGFAVIVVSWWLLKITPGVRG